ncbi:MAG: hypothetical protein HC913_02210 [Microscillaceae bacterium]|nr:hypothetical protein [Microscillaceae bacterium]
MAKCGKTNPAKKPNGPCPHRLCDAGPGLFQAGQPKTRPGLNEGLQKYPQDANLHYYRALIAYKNRDRDLAEMHLSESVQITTQNLDAVLVYGLWLVYRQRLQEGLQALYFAKSQGNETAARVFDLYFKIKEE